IHGAGLAVTGFDVDPGQAGRSGVPTTGSLAELVGGVRVVFLSLPDSRVVESVVYGEDGLLAACGHGQIVVDLSTSAPSSTVKIHADLAERGVELVDAAISGRAAGAQRGAPRGRGGSRRASLADDHGRRLGAGPRHGQAVPGDVLEPRLPHGRARL